MNTKFKKGTLYLLILVFYTVVHSASYAQHLGYQDNLSKLSSEQIKGFPAGSLVLMADGTEKKIEDLRIGELAASYDPVLEDYVVSKVTNLQTFRGQVQPIVSVMLILEELSASLQMNGGLAGVNLEATASYKVLTKNGPKQIGELTENDLLYCYDEAAHRFLNFRVYEITLINKSELQTTYNLQTEDKNFIINSTVVLQTDE